VPKRSVPLRPRRRKKRARNCPCAPEKASPMPVRVHKQLSCRTLLLPCPHLAALEWDAERNARYLRPPKPDPTVPKKPSLIKTHAKPTALLADMRSLILAARKVWRAPSTPALCCSTGRSESAFVMKCCTAGVRTTAKRLFRRCRNNWPPRSEPASQNQTRRGWP